MGIVLSKRLKKIADMVPRCNTAADIGTDHGYIPVWLLENGICSSAIAADINAGPLAKAKETAENSALSDKISFRLCDGLAGVAESEADVIIIAGMGGETIEGILTAAEWTKNKTLVVQPQSKIPELRKWLNENGYCIKDASLVLDAGRYYVVWLIAGGQEDAISFEDCYLERILFKKCDPLLAEYIDHLVSRNNSIIDGLKKSENSSENLETIARLNEMLLKKRGECDSWQK